MTKIAERVVELMKRPKPDLAEDYALLEDQARQLGYARNDALKLLARWFHGGDYDLDADTIAFFGGTVPKPERKEDDG